MFWLKEGISEEHLIGCIQPMDPVAYLCATVVQGDKGI